MIWLSAEMKTLFQLTTSQGGRPISCCNKSGTLWYFNSRPRKEVDAVANTAGTFNYNISTHDLARRSTYRFFPHMLYYLFQLTTSQGGRPEALSRREKLILFQLTTSQGGRPIFSGATLVTSLFQLTTSQGGRQQFLRKKFSFQNHFLCSLHIIYSYYINIVFFSTLFLAKSSFFLVRIP